jgi:hypothetical protein
MYTRTCISAVAFESSRSAVEFKTRLNHGTVRSWRKRYLDAKSRVRSGKSKNPGNAHTHTMHLGRVIKKKGGADSMSTARSRTVHGNRCRPDSSGLE